MGPAAWVQQGVLLCVCVCVCVRVGDCPAHAAVCMLGLVGGLAGLGRVGLSACRGR